MAEKELEHMTLKQKMEYWRDRAEGKEVEKEEPKEKSTKTPVLTDWINLGENFGISIAVWDNGITLRKRKRENDQWIDGEKFNLSHTVLERIFVRIPGWFAMTKKKSEI